MSKLYERHLATAKFGECDKTFVRGMKSALNADYRRYVGWSTGVTAPKISPLECATIRLYIRERQGGMPVSAALTAQGLAWLRSRSVQRVLGPHERAVVENFVRFTLSDFRNVKNDFHLPVWRVWGKGGLSFEYCTGSWQSGIPLTVTS